MTITPSAPRTAHTSAPTSPRRAYQARRTPLRPITGGRRRTASTSSTNPRERTDQLLAQATDQTPLDDLEVEAVVLLNLGLADGMAARYLGRGLEREDLVQVARLGLVKAVQRFRPGLGQSFAGFAAPTIAGEIKRHFRDTGWMVRPPRRLQELGARVREAEKTLEQDLHRRATAEELATALGVDEQQVRAAREAASSFHALSLDVPATAGYAQSEGALDVLDDPFAAIDDAHWLGTALADLTDREREVLRLRFSDQLTQSEIAVHIGVSQMQVSRILRSTLDRLKVRLESSGDRAA